MQNDDELKLSASQEDYLETIYNIIQEKGAARPKDIAAHLKVKAASVTGALKHLAELDLVVYAPYEAAMLTPLGEKIAETITSKHKALLHFFVNVLDIAEEEADDFCCKMEHVIPDHVLERFIHFTEFVGRCPNSGAVWQGKENGYFCQTRNKGGLDCATCCPAAKNATGENE